MDNKKIYKANRLNRRELVKVKLQHHRHRIELLECKKEKTFLILLIIKFNKR